MKTLRQSLIDFDLPLLTAIARCRNIPLTASRQPEAVEQLAEALLSPVSAAIVLQDLATDETDALAQLLANHGQLEKARFTRHFGAIRPMGAARLIRERPWENPVNPAEALWYRGIIFKTFIVDEQGGQEYIYIPTDVQPLITLNSPATPPPQPVPQIAVAAPPTEILATQGRLRENFFNLLVYLQTHPVRLANNAVPTANRQALGECLLPPALPNLPPDFELEFLLHLGRRTDLLTVAHHRLRPNRDPVRDWLQADEAAQVWILQNAWRADPTWNDLWHVPGLLPQNTGWENSPLRARATILEFLEQLNAPANSWLSLDGFVETIKQANPDFQRPHGDYQSWYIKNAAGEMLMGFEHWDTVEGGLIRYLIGVVLPLLGVSKVGKSDPRITPDLFQITPAGQQFLARTPPNLTAAPSPVRLRVDDKFQVWVPVQASLYDRFQLARFAQFDQRTERRTIYQMTRSSLNRALKNGVTPEQIQAFLTRVTNNQIPLRVVERLRAWGTRYGGAKIEQATLLRLQNEQMVSELQQHPEVGPLLGEMIGPTTIVLPAKTVAKVRQLLYKMGYLE